MLPLDKIAVVGPGRLGTALSAALGDAGLTVEGPLGRGVAPTAPVVLLCVPDGEIERAHPGGGHIVGHCSGASPLGRCDFSLHPLMTVPESGARFAGVPAAIAGHAVARELAERLGMVPFTVAEEDRAAYHAAAAMASNFLVILESAAERVAATAGVERQTLVPLVRATVENWATQGRAALTGPIARGDVQTLDRHRAALRERAPELLPMYEALATC
ncbi:MAG: hypothetical protein QOF76_4543 [Solirubrobacteraceae bacterium]|jgi:predicted short-subunit dehydrogenase-like oxidoreductase (DUF2520 family)|nr:hypothetical protein [Solirubrobacteraceae bacterium]